MSISSIKEQLKTIPNLEDKKDTLKDHFNSGRISFSDYRDVLNEVIRKYSNQTHQNIKDALFTSGKYNADDFFKKEKKCDCGAIHTSFPKHHYDWCQVSTK